MGIAWGGVESKGTAAAATGIETLSADLWHYQHGTMARENVLILGGQWLRCGGELVVVVLPATAKTKASRNWRS